MKICVNQEISPTNKALLSKVDQVEVLSFFKEVADQYKVNLQKVLPDIVFRPESGLCFKYHGVNYVFLSNFTSKHGHGTRVREVQYNRKFFAAQGFTIIEVPANLPFEGGAEVKYVKHGDSVDIIFGYGFRTDFKTIGWVKDKLKEILKNDFQKVNIIPAHIISDDYYHIDTALKEIPVIKEGKIVDETIMFYPGAFDDLTQKILKEKFPDALVLTEKDAKSFACNSPTIDKSIIIDDRVSESLCNELKRRGLKVNKIDLSEFFKAGGGGKCLICEQDASLFDFDPKYNKKIHMIGNTKGVFDAIYVNDPYMAATMGTV